MRRRARRAAAIVLDADTAEERGKGGAAVILVGWETTPDDIHGMIQARGVLTAHGGMTSHAAVVARGMGKPCVAGCEGLEIDMDARTVRIGGHELREGDTITIDGGTGRVIIGEVPLVPPQINEDFETILSWADDVRPAEGARDADNPDDAAKAREFGAQGIGLCRTEHMFFGEERLPVMQEMILASDQAGRRVALDRLLPFQQADFEGIFEVMTGLPVTIRLLDHRCTSSYQPLEEATDSRMRHRIKVLSESNPMLGTRGCRIGIQWPEIYEMQVRAIRTCREGGAGAQRATCRSSRSCIRSSASRRSCAALRQLTEEVMAEEAPELDYLCGTMIELPARRAASRRDRRGGGFLLVRDERPYADRARHVARRCGREVPDLLSRGRSARVESVRDARPERCRRPDEDRRRARPLDEAGHQARDLRRARRRAALGRVLYTGSGSTTSAARLPASRSPARRGPGRSEESRRASTSASGG